MYVLTFQFRYNLKEPKPSFPHYPSLKSLVIMELQMLLQNFKTDLWV